MRENNFLVLITLLIFSGWAQGQLELDNAIHENIGKHIYQYYDEDCQPDIAIAELPYKAENRPVPLYSGGEGCMYIKIPVDNVRNKNKAFLEIYNPSIDKVELLVVDQDGNPEVLSARGRSVPRKSWDYDLPNIVFELNFPQGEEDYSFYLRIQNEEQFSLPMKMGPEEKILEKGYRDQIMFGVYAGIMLAMFFYNLFVYFIVRDISYIYYVSHTALVLVNQAAASGIAFLYLWPGNTWLAQHSFVLFTCLVTIAGIRFFFEFLKVKRYEPLMYKVFRVIELVYVLIIVLDVSGLRSLSYQLLFPLQALIGVSILVVSIRIWLKGFRPAKIYIIGWSMLLVGVIIYALKDFGFLPYNYITVHTIQIGSALETILLSFALADKINILKREKEQSQEEALKMSKENQRMVENQKEELAQRVEARTMELQESNEELQVALDNLKDTQSQLVDAEKMASLGQLTAGIAHEINNPINFITSNIKPLETDLTEIYEIVEECSNLKPGCTEEDVRKVKELMEEYDYEFLREEIQTLVQGISDGAQRTSEIVRGLRTFSRLDEDVVKLANLNEGLDSTMVLLNNKVKGTINVVRNYQEDLPDVECFPGKLNQAFMNILNNAIYAVLKQNYDEGEEPTITLSTWEVEHQVAVGLKDNGIGMDEDTKKKMFDPFFTTKEVGEGTGLGMSIVFKIVDKHGGKLDVHSEPGVGTEFVITLPKRQPSEFS